MLKRLLCLLFEHVPGETDLLGWSFVCARCLQMAPVLPTMPACYHCKSVKDVIWVQGANPKCGYHRCKDGTGEGSVCDLRHQERLQGLPS